MCLAIAMMVFILTVLPYIRRLYSIIQKHRSEQAHATALFQKHQQLQRTVQEHLQNYHRETSIVSSLAEEISAMRTMQSETRQQLVGLQQMIQQLQARTLQQQQQLQHSSSADLPSNNNSSSNNNNNNNNNSNSNNNSVITPHNHVKDD